MILPRKITSRIIVRMFGLISLLLVTNICTAVTFVTKPYLQHPTPEAITIMWITDKKCLSWVEFGENLQLNQKSTQSVSGLIAADRINKVRLKNLKPGTRYYYKVVSKEIVTFDPYKVTFGNTISSNVSYFYTPDSNEKETSMLILNDIHERPESIVKLIGMTQQNEYDFVFFNGDIFNYLTSESQITENLIVPSSNVFASVKPFFQVRGNHETRGAFARDYFNYFQFPDDKPYYTFTRGPVFFIVLDSGEDKSDNEAVYAGLVDFDTYRLEQSQWLEQVLQSPACKNALYRVVLMHIPPLYSNGWHGTTHCKELFLPLFNRHNVDMVISGHTHKYGIYSPVAGLHDFPVCIGGGPEDGNRTLIKLKANDTALDIQMLNDAGTEVGRYRVNGTEISAGVRTADHDEIFRVYVQDDTLLVESGIQDCIEIFDLTGQKLKHCQMLPGLNKINGFRSGQFVLLKSRNHIQKVIF
jgi:predicted phosphodiesterase